VNLWSGVVDPQPPDYKERERFTNHPCRSFVMTVDFVELIQHKQFFLSLLFRAEQIGWNEDE